ncbi:alpha/beta fold hydrolase [Croceicoccus mobilis]|uniref:AB hydrolase-1 domain-containing protein n=1 Tax=Croceicoccus mobilis TaxID=1703339 RepID=A0A916Z6V5_9SPHN|nr:alpha/beta fold hydrolase [Croceicoccus mobilis]GGD79375.1 hypothetical protein GCM10010990_31590 [Croceicoccus mobilis]
MQASPTPPGGIARHFVQIDGRNIHYLRAGKGPPLLLIHPSPYNAHFWAGSIARWADRYTCIAPDTPGFGLSDPLAPQDMTVDGLTHAMARLVETLGLTQCRLIGSHTGAAIALELAVAHPDIFTGVVLEAVPLFTEEEQEHWFTDAYFSPLKVSEHGEHLTWAWTRVRDADVYFPWLRRQPEHFYNGGRGSAAKLHKDLLDYFECARHFRPAYRSAVAYEKQAMRSLARLDIPALLYASSADVMASHIDRLPPLKPGQEKRSLGTDEAEINAVVDSALASFKGDVPPGELPASPPRAAQLIRQFVSIDGGQAMVRQTGGSGDPAILLLHDAPGSAAALEPLMREMAGGARVVAPDLPGSGESSPLPEQSALSDYAAWLESLCDALGLESISIYGVGLGSSLALSLQARCPARVRKVAVNGLLLPDDAKRLEMAKAYAPRIEIKDNGSHWYDVWSMLRDSLTVWPWYARTAADVRRMAEPCSADELHDWTVEVMKQFGCYHHFINAALAYDLAPMLATAQGSLIRCTDPAHRFSVFEGEVVQMLPECDRVEISRQPGKDGPALRNALLP